MAKGKTTRNFIIVFIVLILISILSCFGLQFLNHTGIFRNPNPGQINYDESLSTETRSLITEKLTNIVLNQDITINSYHTNKANSEDLLYNILVPVTDFYNPIADIASNAIDTAISAGEIQLIPISDLTNFVKLLSIDNNYYLDTFNSGADFEYLKITGEDSEDITMVKTLLQENLPTFPNQTNVLTFAQTGVTALSRGMNTKLDEVGDANYFAANIGDFLKSFDLTHTSNEASFSEYASGNNICSKPEMVNTLMAIGLDIVELTGNHNQDCGDDAAIATIQKYQELGIKVVGGGESAVAAADPLTLSKKGTNITMLAYNLSTGGYTLDGTPGANFYTPEKAAADIAAAKARGDFIIIDVQYYECSEYADEWDNPACDRADSAAGDQIGFFRELIDMGADVVVGTSAHQPQTYELYNNGVIYYGLGNLFFDQYWWPGTQRSLILVHYFYHGKLLQTRIIPTIYDNRMQVELMDNSTAEWFINRLNQVRPN